MEEAEAQDTISMTRDSGNGEVSQSHSSTSRPWKSRDPELGMLHHCGPCHPPLPMVGPWV